MGSRVELAATARHKARCGVRAFLDNTDASVENGFYPGRITCQKHVGTGVKPTNQS